MRKLPLILIVLFISAFHSCKTDFEVNEDWKEIDIIYSLLDVNDTVHYVKINKAFLNKNEDAYRLATIEDSIYHKDSLDVRMQEWRNGTKIKETQLEKIYSTDKDSGTFANPGQYLYRLPLGYKLDPSATYKLIVKNTSTGVEASAETALLDTVKFLTPGPSSTSIRFSKGTSSITNYSSGRGAKFYEMIININYIEIDSNNNITNHSIRWPIYSKYLTSNTSGGQDMRFLIKGDDFYKILIDNIPFKNNVTRKFLPFEFKVTGGGDEIYYYMNVYQPTIGVVQKKPEYTNIKNGQGVFSSRSRNSFKIKLNPLTIDDLNIFDETKYLNFVK